MPPVPLRRNRNFVLFQAGQLLSNAGTQVTSIAYPLLVLALTHSAVKAGIVSFARAAPMAALAIPAGVAADHWSRRALMISADALRAGALAFLALGLVVLHVPYWVIPCVAFVEGAGAAAFAAAQPGALRAVVPKEQLLEAAGAQTGRQAAVRIVGPPAGGALFEVGRAVPFLVDAVSYACSTVSLLMMRVRFEEDRLRETTPVRARISEGLSFTWHQPFLRVTAILYGLLNFTAPALLFCIVVIGEDQGLSGGAIGLLTACFAAQRPPRVVPLAVRATSAQRACRAASRGVGLAGMRCLPRLAERPRARPRPRPGRARRSLDRLGGQRAPDRHDPRSAAGAGRVGAQRHRPVHRVTGPAGGRVLLQHTTARWTVGFFTAWALGLALWGTLSRALRVDPTTDAVPRQT